MAADMLERIDHVNLVVQDLEAMTRFYTRVLGLIITNRVRISGPWVEEVVGLEGVGLGGVEADVVYLDLPDGPRVELIQYLGPSGRRPEGLELSNTPGLRHLAFRVADIDEVAAALRAGGIEPLSKVSQVPDEQVTYTGGVRKRLVYFRDPEQNLLELCEYR